MQNLLAVVFKIVYDHKLFARWTVFGPKTAKKSLKPPPAKSRGWGLGEKILRPHPQMG